MPFFGSKKEKSPNQGYPTAQQTAPPPQQYAPPPQVAPGAPPAYTQYPQQMGPAPGYAAAPPPQNMPYGAPPQQYMAQQQPPMYAQGAVPAYQQPQMVMVQGGYDAGARFDGIAQPNIPPPPPGCAPNPAQMAQMQGHNVVMTQQKGSFLTGGSDGGYVWF